MTQILDHGYCNLIETWGSDERIIESARMSTSKGFQGWGPKACGNCHDNSTGIYDLDKLNCKKCGGSGKESGDEKLLAYLYKNRHMTPFEMAGMTIEVQAPIFVFREWHRHRTQSYNELSARYTELPNLMYMPSRERLAAGFQSTVNKQGSEARTLSDYDYQMLTNTIWSAFQAARASYDELLRAGVSREIARVVIPVAQFSRMRASANLRNWLAFLTLRTDPAAQWEIRQYANEVATLIKANFPRTYELYIGESNG